MNAPSGLPDAEPEGTHGPVIRRNEAATRHDTTRRLDSWVHRTWGIPDAAAPAIRDRGRVVEVERSLAPKFSSWGEGGLPSTAHQRSGSSTSKEKWNSFCSENVRWSRESQARTRCLRMKATVTKDPLGRSGHSLDGRGSKAPNRFNSAHDGALVIRGG